MASGGGFSFGTSTSQAKPLAGGFSFGTGAQTTSSSGTTGGFGFGTNAAAASATTSTATSGFGGFGTAASSTVNPQKTTAQGFSFGTPASTGLTLGAQATTNASTGLSLGTPAASTSALGLALGAKPTTASTLTLGGAQTGFSFAKPATSTVASTLTLGAKPTTTSTLTLGAPATSTTSFGFGQPAKTTATTGLGGTFGGFGQTTSAATSAPSLSGFTASAPATSANVGLGGVDPKASVSGTGNSGNNGKSSDNKAVKECSMPQQICETVEEFKKFVKNEKTVRENIARMSSKPLYKVQEEVASLKQLLSLVSTGLQRNASAIEKLKRESVQELKYAEMAQRTKDTPPGLQYENVAPTEYFHLLAEKFESQMIKYRQQIEEMESHLASMQQGGALSPQELANLLNKLHEGFVVLAAQLQVVHESVKAQKEQYLNYRKVFLGDSSNIFEKRKKVEEKTGSKVSVGPTPFTGMSNTSLAMASALARAQQPGAAPAVGTLQPGTGIFGASTGVGQPAASTGGFFGAGAAPANTGTGLFGGTTGSQATTGLFGAKPTGFGVPASTQSTGFSFNPPTATVRPLG